MRFAAALLVLISTPALADPGYVGVWAPSTEHCEADPHKTEDAPFRIGTRKVEGSTEWSCTIDQVAKDGKGWRASLACASEGSAYRRDVRWSASKGVLTEVEKGKTRDYAKCWDSDFKPIH
jgi:hypothetical protein